MAQVNKGNNIVLLSLLSNLAITAAKFTAYIFSLSPSMLAESFHSLGDSFNQFLIWIGLQRGKIGPCHQYPMGRGRAQYIFNLMAAQGLFVGGAYTVYHSLHLLFSPLEHNTSISLITILVLVFSALLEGYILASAVKEVNQQRKKTPFLTYLKNADDPSVLAIVLEDGVAVLGIFLAIIGICLGSVLNTPLPDIIAATIIGLLLIAMAIYLFKTNYGLIVGRSINSEEQRKIKDYISKLPEIENIVHFQTEVLAPGKVRLSMEVEFNGHQTINKDQVTSDISKLDTISPSKVLAISHDRGLRTLGPLIDELESKIQIEFPQISLIDTEPH